jgi:hypothetical protein
VEDEGFVISSEGELRFVSAPDYETQQTYSLVISATDGTNTSTQTVSIQVLDGNDAPFFKDEWRDENSALIAGPNFTIIENFQGKFGSFSPVDPEVDDLTLSISGGEIEILSDNGLQFISPPDYELQTVHRATLTISDGEYTAEQEITVTILNENDNSPVVTSEADFSVIENQVPIGKVTATDADGDALSFELSGTDGSLLSVDVDTGDLAFKTAADYETKSSYEATVTTSDGTFTTTQDIVITVTDETDE